MASKTVYTCDICKRELNEFMGTKSVAFNNGARLSFHVWSDNLSTEKGALHFHSDVCAKDYLEDWLDKRRLNAPEVVAVGERNPLPPPTRVSGWVEEAPVPAFQRLEEAAPVQELDSAAAQLAPVKPLSVGDVVQLMSGGGVKMTVEGVRSDGVCVDTVWFDSENQTHHGTFATTELVAAEQELDDGYPI